VVVDAGSLETGTVERDNQIRSPEFLDIRVFPEIGFRSREIRPGNGEGRFVIVGDLTIRDVTREVTVIAERQGPTPPPTGEPKLVFVAHATVDRQDFGLHWNQDLDHGGIVAGDKVDLQIRIDARRA
jgi:polyisoprenoid-binding protein YceI